MPDEVGCIREDLVVNVGVRHLKCSILPVTKYNEAQTKHCSNAYDGLRAWDCHCVYISVK